MTNPESQMRSEEMQAKAEAMVLAVLKSADYPAAAKAMSDALGLPALLTAEAERDELKHPRIYSRCPACLNDTLTLNKGRLLCTWFECKNPTVMDWVGQPEWQNLFAESVNKEMDQLRAELTNFRRNVATLYEWIQGNTSLTGKQKEAADHVFDQLDKGVKEDSDLRAELVSLRQEQAGIHKAICNAEQPAGDTSDLLDLVGVFIDHHKQKEAEHAAAKSENAALMDVAKAARKHTVKDHEVRDALRTLAEKGVVL